MTANPPEPIVLGGMNALVVLLLSASSVALQQGTLQSPSAAAAQPGTVPLHGTAWTVLAVGELEPREPAARKTPRLVFHPGGVLTGFDGCNSLGGDYTADERFVKVGPLIGTLVACPIPDQLDRRFREALMRARQWQIHERELRLLDEAGTLLVRLEAQSN